MITFKKIAVFTLLAAMLMTPATLDARKKKEKKFVKKEVVVNPDIVVEQTPRPVTVSNPAKQLYGEWDIESLGKNQKKLISRERAFIYLDFSANKVYGNTGGTAFNCNFKQQGNDILFRDIITPIENKQSNNERDIFKALKDVQKFGMESLYGVDILILKNGKGQELMRLRRQNLDFLNGPWRIKELNGENVFAKDARIVVDAPMLTVHGNTGCNIINGSIYIDTDKDLAITFEDLQSSGHICDNIDVETALLIALEQTESAKRINDDEMALLDGKGKIVIVLSRLNMRKR